MLTTKCGWWLLCGTEQVSAKAGASHCHLRWRATHSSFNVGAHTRSEKHGVQAHLCVLGNSPPLHTYSHTRTHAGRRAGIRPKRLSQELKSLGCSGAHLCPTASPATPCPSLPGTQADERSLGCPSFPLLSFPGTPHLLAASSQTPPAPPIHPGSREISSLIC